MASNNCFKDDFMNYYEKKFGKNEKINMEQAWKLFKKFCKKQNNYTKHRDSSDDHHSDHHKNKHCRDKSHSKERRKGRHSSSSSSSS